MDFRETFREIWNGCIYIFDKMRGREPTPDVGARRVAHYEGAFGKPRSQLNGGKMANGSDIRKETNGRKKHTPVPVVRVEVEESAEAEIGEERQWLGLGDNYGYGLGKVKREKSDGLEEQIERELQRRGYGSRMSSFPPLLFNLCLMNFVRWWKIDISGRGHVGAAPDVETAPGGHKRQQSWWRSIYNRVSQSGRDAEEEHLTPVPSKRRSKAKSKSRSRQHSRDRNGERRLLFANAHDFDDPPPQGVLLTYRSQHQRERGSLGLRSEGQEQPDLRNDGEADILAPLSVFNKHRSSHHHRQQQHRNSNLDPSHYPTSGQNSHSNPISNLHEGMNLNPYPDSSLLAAPFPFNRSDSLLGRVFPYNTDNESTEHGDASDSAHTMLSASADGVSPSKATPRARLTTSTLVIEARGYEFSMAGERSTSQSQVGLGVPGYGWTHSAHTIHPSSAEVVGSPLTPSPPPVPDKDIELPRTQLSHRRESAHHGAALNAPPSHPSSPPTPSSPVSASAPPLPFLHSDNNDAYTVSPISADSPHPSPTSTSPFSMPVPNILSSQDAAPTPTPAPSRLRRSSAQIYWSRGNSSRPHRQSSLPVPQPDFNPPQVPEHTYTRQPMNHTSSHRRISVTPDNIPQYAVPTPTSSHNRPHRSRYSVDNMNGNITQPSSSGENNLSNYPDLTNRMSDLSRPPGIPPTIGLSARISHPRGPQADSVYSNQAKYNAFRGEAGAPRHLLTGPVQKSKGDPATRRPVP